MHGEETCEPKRLAPLHTGKGLAPEQTGEKEDKAAQLRQPERSSESRKLPMECATVRTGRTESDPYGQKFLGGLSSNNDYS